MSLKKDAWLTALTNLVTATLGEADRIGLDAASSCEDDLSKSLMCGVTKVPEALGTPFSGTSSTPSVSVFEEVTIP
jgi:hypothetical protein